MCVKTNSEFLFLFEAINTNPNGDPDQENKPRMDYETNTALVSDARRKRDCRDFFKNKGFRIFVDTLGDKKVPMDEMFNAIFADYLSDEKKFNEVLKNNSELLSLWDQLKGDKLNKSNLEIYNEIKNKKNKKNDEKQQLTSFNNLLLTEIIKDALIDIRLFGSAMAVEDVTRTYTGPVQITWGYSLHSVDLVKSSTITSIMNDDSSTFGKEYKLHYALIAHYGTVNKFAALKTGMSDRDKELFRKALVQGMMNNLTDSKQGQTPLLYLEIEYDEDFDGYLGDLRRFIKVSELNQGIRSLNDLAVDFSELIKVLEDLKGKGYVKNICQWVHPGGPKQWSGLFEKELNSQTIDLLKPINSIESRVTNG